MPASRTSGRTSRRLHRRRLRLGRTAHLLPSSDREWAATALELDRSASDVLIMVELYVGSEDGLLVFAYADGTLELVARAAPGNAVRGIALEANGIGAY